MILAGDIETQGRNCQKFLCGTLTNTATLQSETYLDKKAMLKSIITKGQACDRQGKNLSVYFFVSTYDLHGILDFSDPNLTMYSDSPLIWAYKINGKERIHFLDAYAIYNRKTLHEVGEMIGETKTPRPEILATGQKPTSEQMQEIIKYNIQDTIVVAKSINKMREKLKEQGVNIRRLYTISQIAITNLLQIWQKTPEAHQIWMNNRGQIKQTSYPEQIHAAYRGGKNECFQTGTFESVTRIDRNSSYAAASTQIQFPKLDTEKLFNQPQKTHEIKDIISTLGISRALIYNRSCDYGLLPIRTDSGNYFPKRDKYLIGTYTHDELREATKEGYEIKQIQWTLKYEEAPNPFQTSTPLLYQLRTKAGSPFDYYFYKQMLNCSFGKFAQRKDATKIEIDSVEKAPAYLARRYEILRGAGMNYLYRLTNPNTPRKRYYCPILPTLITAKARILAYRDIKKIPLKDLIYTDTDDIIYTGQHTSKFKIGTALGEYKLQEQDQPMILYGRKTYKIGQTCKASGTPRSDLDPKKFEAGYSETYKMQTYKTAPTQAEIGTFIKEIKDYKRLNAGYKEMLQQYSELKLYIDMDIQDISHFLPTIKTIQTPEANL